MIGVLVFCLIPIVSSLVFSFMDYDLVGGSMSFIGVKNFVRILGGKEFPKVLQHTLTYLSLYLPLILITGAGGGICCSTTSSAAAACSAPSSTQPVITSWGGGGGGVDMGVERQVRAAKPVAFDAWHHRAFRGWIPRIGRCPAL